MRDDRSNCRRLLHRWHRYWLVTFAGQLVALFSAELLAFEPGSSKEKAEIIDPDLLAAVKDVNKKPISEKETRARNEAIVIASQTSARAFANSAHENRDLTYADLMGWPRKYRGEVIHAEGVLRRLVALPVPDWVKAQKIQNLYEAWIDSQPHRPYLILVAQLPEGITPKGKLGQRVSFDGYFFKKHLAKEHESQIVPLLIGRSFSISKKKTASSKSDRKSQLEQAPAIDHLLFGVVDKTRAPDAGANIEEFWGFCETVLAASRTSLVAFSDSAKKNASITFAHVHNDPASFRGKVIPLQGRLVRLRQWPTPLYLKSRGIKQLYEGWIFGPTGGSNPWCVIFSELPNGIKVGENIDYSVKVSGYFFKKYRYTAPKDDRYAPMIIARTITLSTRKSTSPFGKGFSDLFAIGLTSLIGGVIALVLVLGWWFRRTDRRLRSQIARSRSEPTFDIEPAVGEQDGTVGSLGEHPFPSSDPK